MPDEQAPDGLPIYDLENAREEDFSTQRQVLPQCEQALLIVDFITPLNFDGAEHLAPDAVAAARALGSLRQRMVQAGVPVVYANDNYGLWQSNFRAMVAYCLRQPGEVGEITRMIAPGPQDIAILKPRHSAFYGTPLELLLDQMKVERLVLAGLSTDMCVQMTAMDAYVRSYPTWVPADCTAAASPDAKDQALRYMAEVLKCDVRPSQASPAQ